MIGLDLVPDIKQSHLEGKSEYSNSLASNKKFLCRELTFPRTRGHGGGEKACKQSVIHFRSRRKRCNPFTNLAAPCGCTHTWSESGGQHQLRTGTLSLIGTASVEAGLMLAVQRSGGDRGIPRSTRSRRCVPHLPVFLHFFCGWTSFCCWTRTRAGNLILFGINTTDQVPLISKSHMVPTVCPLQLPAGRHYGVDAVVFLFSRVVDLENFRQVSVDISK